MSRQSFGELLKKYLKGECTPDEKQFIEHWYATLDNENSTPNLLENEALEERLWDEIQSKMYDVEVNEEQPTKIIRWKKAAWISIAASVLMVGAWLFINKPEKTPEETISTIIEESDWVEQKNTSAGTITVHLEDGSTVKLSSNSLIRFPKHFLANKREVHLDGNAFFDIQKQATRPFYVYANDVITKVLGTSFYVRTEKNTKQVKVEVVSGRVAVYRQTATKEKTPTGVVLTPNHAATYFNEQKHFVTSLVENPIIIPSKEVETPAQNFQFDDVPLAEVLRKLENAYGIDFTVENDKQYNCLLTANLNNQTLYTQLELICAALHAKYEVQGTTILLSGKGCN